MILKEGQLAQKVAAVRRRGGTPEMVVLSSSYATLLHPAPHGAFRQGREESVGAKEEENKDRRYSARSLRRLACARVLAHKFPASSLFFSTGIWPEAWSPGRGYSRMGPSLQRGSV